MGTDTFICTWPHCQRLLSVNIKPGEYTGLAARGIAAFGLAHRNFFAAGPGEPLSAVCNTLQRNTVRA